MPKLLLADDSLTIQRVIELTFSGEDVQVLSVSDGEEAVARIEAERPDIVLADIGMPRRNGYDVAAFVKGRPDLAHIPVLLLAGAFEPVDQGRAQQVRCDGVLVKPFEPQQVITRVRDLLAGRNIESTAANAGPGTTSPEPWLPTPESRIPSPESRVPSPESIVEMPEPTASDASESLDDYFDRLDAAFASLNRAQGGASPLGTRLDDLTGQVDVPTIDELLRPVAIDAPGTIAPPSGRMASPPLEPPDSTPTLTAAPAAPDAGAAAVPPVRNLIADAFVSLLAAEQGQGADSSTGAASNVSPAITDELVDELARRVLARLAPDVLRDVVARVVSEVSERLVREEIARIRASKG